MSQSIQDAYDDEVWFEEFLDANAVDGGRYIGFDDGCCQTFDPLGFSRGGSFAAGHVPWSHPASIDSPVEVLTATSTPIHHEEALGLASILIATAINRGYPGAVELADAFADAGIGLRLLNWPTPALQPLVTVIP